MDEPRLTTELLLAHTLNMKRISLYLNFDRPLSEEELSSFRNLIKRRLNNEPVQYITEKTEFMGYEIETPTGVFIPRQETEILVYIVKNWIDREKLTNFILYDIGTGTGAIAIFFAAQYSQAKIYASDISRDAVVCAKRNIERNKLSGRIVVLTGNLLYPFKDTEKADVIISNPPYIPTSELNDLPEIVKKEPREALDGGEKGLNFIERIIKEAREFLKPNGLLAIEMGINQSKAVRNIFERSKAYKSLQTFSDLRGIKRVHTGVRL